MDYVSHWIHMLAQTQNMQKKQIAALTHNRLQIIQEANSTPTSYI